LREAGSYGVPDRDGLKKTFGVLLCWVEYPFKEGGAGDSLSHQRFALATAPSEREPRVLGHQGTVAGFPQSRLAP